MKEALKKLEQLFEQGHLSRRAFLRRSAALGLAGNAEPDVDAPTGPCRYAEAGRSPAARP